MQARPQPRSPVSLAGTQAPLELSSDDDAPLDAPPPEYFHAARSLCPRSSRRDALKAWDRSRGIGAGSITTGDPFTSARVQAALGALVDMLGSPGAPTTGYARASTSTGKRPASPTPNLCPSSPTSSPRIKRPGTSDRKGKDKAVLVLDSDADADADELIASGNSSVEIVSSPPARRKRRDKGKGPAREVLVLDDYKSGDAIALPTFATPEKPPSALAQVLAVLPDVHPDFVAELLSYPEHAASGAEGVVKALLGMKEDPRAGDDERRKQEEEREREVDWLDVEARMRAGEQPSVAYMKMALDQLYTQFDRLPSALIKQSFLSPAHARFFAPTWMSLHTQNTAGSFADQRLQKARKPPKPVVRVVRRQRVDASGRVEEWDEEEVEQPPPELRREMDWLRGKMLAERAARRAAAESKRAALRERERTEAANERARAQGVAIECGCCYDEVAVENTGASGVFAVLLRAQCAEGHLFCKGCALANASDRIGRRQAVLPCMSADCTASFEPSTYASFLEPKMVDSLAALAQQKDVDEAFDGVEGFEKCPFCPYACLVENPEERLFPCERPECRKVSCRKCRKEGHVPLTCEEADEERRLPGVHAVAEAMSAALIRPCPKCKVACLKQDGCNKMVCSQCNAYWCYTCRQIIKGYEHFQEKRADGSTCALHDDTEMLDYNQVEEARLRAQEALDAHTAQDAARLLASTKPVRGAPIFPVGGAPVPAPAPARAHARAHAALAAAQDGLQFVDEQARALVARYMFGQVGYDFGGQ